MKLAKAFVLAAAFALLLVGSAWAQVEPAIDKGSLELSNTIGFSQTSLSIEGVEDDPTTTMISVNPTVGYFVTPMIEVEGFLIINYKKVKNDLGYYDIAAHASNDDEQSRTELGLVARGLYNFVDDKALVPFVGVGIGAIMNSNNTDVENTEETSLVLPEVLAGARLFLGEQAAIRGQAYFRMVTNSGGAKDLDETTFGILNRRLALRRPVNSWCCVYNNHHPAGLIRPDFFELHAELEPFHPS